MNKTIKLIAALIIAVMVISLSSVVFAAATSGINPSDITAKYENVQSANMQSLAQNILGWVRNIAAILSVVLIAILGVKFMLGSTEERAEYKKSFMPLIIGLFVVLAATTIASWIWDVLSAGV